LQFELDQHARKTGQRVTFSKEAREEFLKFALSAAAAWSGNFRDLNAAVARMGTLAKGARISLDLVHEEIDRLKNSWVDGQPMTSSLLSELLTADQLERLDLFDRVQLEHVIEVCRQSRSMSDAGRSLFHASRSRKASSNDADRLRKYLGRFSLERAQVVGSRKAG
jgi:transcriptional regulatory protein RtcR